MGFMAGFGKGFSTSFEAQRDREHEKDQDEFKLMYGDYVSRRDKIDEWKRDDAKKVNLAKDLVMTEQWPMESWTKIHDFLRDGMSVNEVQEFMRANNPVIGPDTSTSSAVSDMPDDGVHTGKPNKPAGANAQTGNMGYDTSGVQDAPNPEEDDHAGLLSGIFGKRKSRKDRTLDRISEVAGVPRSEIEDALSGANYTPEKLAASSPTSITFVPKRDEKKLSTLNSVQDWATELVLAQDSGDPARIALAEKGLQTQKDIAAWNDNQDAIKQGAGYPTSFGIVKDANGKTTVKWLQPNAQGGFQDSDGNPITGEVKPFSPAMSKRYAEIVQRMTSSQPVQDYYTGLSKFAGTKQAADEMTQLVVQSQGHVLDLSGTVASKIDEYSRDLAGIADLIDSTQHGGDDNVLTPEEVDEMDKVASGLKSQIDSGTLSGARLLSAQTALFRAKAIKFAYDMAAQNGQTGKNVSAPEFDRFYEMIPSNPVAFSAFMKTNIDDQKALLQHTATTINKFNPEIRQFNKEIGAEMEGVVPYPDELEDVPSNLAPIGGQDTQGADTSGGYKVGDTYTNEDTNITYRFKGGDAGKQENWEEVK